MQLKLNDAFVQNGLDREQIVLVYRQHSRQSDRRVSFIWFILSDSFFVIYHEGNVPF